MLPTPDTKYLLKAPQPLNNVTLETWVWMGTDHIQITAATKLPTGGQCPVWICQTKYDSHASQDRRKHHVPMLARRMCNLKLINCLHLELFHLVISHRKMTYRKGDYREEKLVFSYMDILILEKKKHTPKWTHDQFCVAIVDILSKSGWGLNVQSKSDSLHSSVELEYVDPFMLPLCYLLFLFLSFLYCF